MQASVFKRALGLSLALLLMLSVLPLTALATEDSEFILIELKGTDVTLDETVFEYTGRPIEPNVTVRVEERLLTLGTDYRVTYVDNLAAGTGKVIVEGIATAAPSYGYTGKVEIPFTINPKLTEITGTDVTIEGTEFAYTGQAIEPAISVSVEGVQLTPDQDYSVTYENNIQPGTATVTVRGLTAEGANLGYTGTVTIDFTIAPDSQPEQPEENPDGNPDETPDEKPEEKPLTQIQGTDVTMDSTRFDYTGKEIQPKVTVTVGGKVLTEGTDYSLTYANNVQVGTATVTVTGLESGGYTGEVKMEFTIVEVPQKVEYKITKGSSAVWNKASGKNLSFTADGKYEDFAGVTINGKTLDSQYFTVKEGSTVVTLKHTFLEKLSLGSYTITLHFTDGEATGTFRVAAALDDTNPKTGDGIHLATAILFISLTALIGFGYAYNKKLWK